MRTCSQESGLSQARAACRGSTAARRCRTPWWRSGRRPCTAREGWSQWRPARWPSPATPWPSRAGGCWRSSPSQAGRAVESRQRLAENQSFSFSHFFNKNHRLTSWNFLFLGSTATILLTLQQQTNKDERNNRRSFKPRLICRKQLWPAPLELIEFGDRPGKKNWSSKCFKNYILDGHEKH